MFEWVRSWPLSRQLIGLTAAAFTYTYLVYSFSRAVSQEVSPVIYAAILVAVAGGLEAVYVADTPLTPNRYAGAVAFGGLVTVIAVIVVSLFNATILLSMAVWILSAFGAAIVLALSGFDLLFR